MNDRWKHRRRMAYASLVSGLLFPLVVAYNAEVGGIAMAFYGFVGAIVGLFIGYATADDKWQKENKNVE